MECPGTRREATMDGFVADYISFFTWEKGRQPTYDEYAQIMQAYAPEQVPVLSGLAREFRCSITWFCEVPSQTFMNRSFWTAATCTPLPTGGTINAPMSPLDQGQHCRDDLQPPRGSRKTWKVYTRNRARQHLIHTPQLHDKFAKPTSCRSSSSKSMPRTGRCRTSL